MGDIADAIINGDFDEQTGEWLGEGDGYPRTMEQGFYNSMDKRTFIEPRQPDKYAKSTKAIRKELAILIKKRIADNPDNISENVIVNKARQEMNTKYGKGWREQF